MWLLLLIVIVILLILKEKGRRERDLIINYWAGSLMSNPKMLAEYRSSLENFQHFSTTDSTVLAGYGGSPEELQQQLRLFREVVRRVDRGLASSENADH